VIWVLLLGGVVGGLLVSRWRWQGEAVYWRKAYELEHANHLNTVECATDALMQMQEDNAERAQRVRDVQVPYPLNDPRLN